MPEHRQRPREQKPVPPPQLAKALGSTPRSSLGSWRALLAGAGSPAPREAKSERLARRRSFILSVATVGWRQHCRGVFNQVRGSEGLWGNVAQRDPRRDRKR